MIKYFFLCLMLLIVGCSDDDDNERVSKNWQIGPIINGKNSSVGNLKITNNFFDFPLCSETKREDGPAIHYVTKKAEPPLKGTMVLEYVIEASPNAVFYGADGGGDGKLSLYFQRRGDDFSLEKYNSGFRWWSINRVQLRPGSGKISTPLEVGNWTPDNGLSAFNIAKDNAIRVGFTFGGNKSAGHGVCLLSGTAKFIIKDFRFEI